MTMMATTVPTHGISNKTSHQPGRPTVFNKK